MYAIRNLSDIAHVARGCNKHGIRLFFPHPSTAIAVDLSLQFSYDVLKGINRAFEWTFEHIKLDMDKSGYLYLTPKTA
jgi:hypothetical protein